MLLGNRYIAKLYLLAKHGNKEEFKKLVKESNILNNLNELNGKEASILIYGYNKLKVFDHESQRILEDLYLHNEAKMNMHDHVMCGYSFMHSKNKRVQEHLLSAVNRSWPEIKRMQTSKPNIGLIAYLAQKENNKYSPVWGKIEDVFNQTMACQDERNFMTVLFAFSKMKWQEDSIWLSLEKYIWAKGFESFSNRNKTLIVYSLSKVMRGSTQFWEQAERIILKLEFQNSEDIQFCSWAFAQMGISNEILWHHLLDQQNKLWSEVSLADVEIMAWGIGRVQKNNMELWQKLVNKSYLGSEKSSNKYSQNDDLLKIGEHLTTQNLQGSHLFQSLLQKLRDLIHNKQINFNNLKRLIFIKYYIEQDMSLFNQEVQQQLLQTLMTKIQSLPKDQTQGYQCMSFLNDLIKLATQYGDKKYLEKIILEFLKIQYKNLDSEKTKFLYIQAGAQLIKYNQTDILRQLCKKELQADLFGNESNLIYYIKIIHTYPESKKFFEQVASSKSKSPDVFVHLTFQILHEHNYLVSSQNYKLFVNALKSIYNSDQQKALSQLITLLYLKDVDIIVEFTKTFKMEIKDYVEHYSNEEIEKLHEEMQFQTEISRNNYRQKNQLMDGGVIDLMHLREKQ